MSGFWIRDFQAGDMGINFLFRVLILEKLVGYAVD